MKSFVAAATKSFELDVIHISWKKEINNLNQFIFFITQLWGSVGSSMKIMCLLYKHIIESRWLKTSELQEHYLVHIFVRTCKKSIVIVFTVFLKPLVTSVNLRTTFVKLLTFTRAIPSEEIFLLEFVQPLSNHVCLVHGIQVRPSLSECR